MQFLFAESIKLYEEFDDEAEIDFIEDGKKIFKEIIETVIAIFEGRLRGLKEE